MCVYLRTVIATGSVTYKEAARPSAFLINSIKMYESHNPLDVDMAALKKGEIDLGTSMYTILRVPLT